MVIPPSPESPAVRFHRGNPAFMSTPRVGMLVSSNDVSDEEDDDVSVLTFQTLQTKDTTLTSSPSFVSHESNRSGDMAESKVFRAGEEGIKNSLSHISEESQNSSEYNKTPKNDDYNVKEDDESLSLAESVLDSANRVLSSIGRSSYYSGFSTKLKPTPSKIQNTFSPPPQPNGKHPSPVKHGDVHVLNEKSSPEASILGVRQGKVSSISNMYSNTTRGAPLTSENSNLSSFKTRPTQYNSASYKTTSTDEDELHKNLNQSNFYGSSCYKKAANDSTFPEKTTRDTHCKKAAASSTNKGDKLQRIQAETKQLQLLLREKQLETKLAMSELDASIRKANELLLD
jgi:hypothetical protein